MQFDLPQFDLLIPRATAVLPELIGSLWVYTRLTHVSGNKDGEQGKQGLKFYLFTEHLHSPDMFHVTHTVLCIKFRLCSDSYPYPNPFRRHQQPII